MCSWETIYLVLSLIAGPDSYRTQQKHWTSPLMKTHITELSAAADSNETTASNQTKSICSRLTSIYPNNESHTPCRCARLALRTYKMYHHHSPQNTPLWFCQHTTQRTMVKHVICHHPVLNIWYVNIGWLTSALCLLCGPHFHARSHTLIQATYTPYKWAEGFFHLPQSFSGHPCDWCIRVQLSRMENYYVHMTKSYFRSQWYGGRDIMLNAQRGILSCETTSHGGIG